MPKIRYLQLLQGNKVVNNNIPRNADTIRPANPSNMYSKYQRPQNWLLYIKKYKNHGPLNWPYVLDQGP